MLGGIKVFRDEFATPIEKRNDSEKQKLLKKLIEPLILRRTKEQVAKELPPLTEQIVYCEMSDEQSRIYEEEKSKTRRMIIDAFENSQTDSISVNILSALTRLRQLANHPAMLDEYSEIPSGKFEEITQMVESVISENHKILIFSSFVKHLNQVESYLQESNIGYEMLTGSTTNRENVVENFQNDPDKKIFLISLKAGGVGLNLTAADYIFILDPWWNPAAEMQAASRAHRIGQTKKVFVYRFISRNTVEEKIISLQSHKENLAHEFVNSNNPMVILNKEQIMSLVE
jgi:SNF2 family DNA or RNA helicase